MVENQTEFEGSISLLDMSKPNLLSINVAVGFFTNSRTLELVELVGDRGFYLPIMLWSFCAENQIDGNLGGYTPKRFAQIFQSKSLVMTEIEAKRLVQAMVTVGFMSADFVMHSWDRFNAHICNFEAIKAQKKAAAEARWAKRAETEGDGKKKISGPAAASSPAANNPTAGAVLAKPAPIFRQIESCQRELTEILAEMQDVRDNPKLLQNPGEKAAQTKRWKALCEQKQKLERRIRELHKEQSGVK